MFNISQRLLWNGFSVRYLSGKRNQRNIARGKNKGYNLIGIEENCRVVRMEVDYERNIIVSRKQS